MKVVIMSQGHFSVWKMLAVLGVILSSVSVISILHESTDLKISLGKTGDGKERNLGTGGQSFSASPKSAKIGKKEAVSASDSLNDETDESQAPPDGIALKSPPKMMTEELMVDEESEVIPPHPHGQKFLEIPEIEIEAPSQIESAVQSVHPQTPEDILKNLQVINGDASQHVGDSIGQIIETLHNMIKMLRNRPNEPVQPNLSVRGGSVSSSNPQVTTVSQQNSTNVPVPQSTQAHQVAQSVQNVTLPNTPPVQTVPNLNLGQQGGQGTHAPPPTQIVPNAPPYPGVNFHVPQQGGRANIPLAPLPPQPPQQDVEVNDAIDDFDFGPGFESIFNDDSNFEEDITAPPEAPVGVNPPVPILQKQSQGTLKSQLKREIARRLGESSLAQGFAFLFGEKDVPESHVNQTPLPDPEDDSELVLDPVDEDSSTIPVSSDSSEDSAPSRQSRSSDLRGSWSDQFDDGSLFNHPWLNVAAGALGIAMDYVERESRRAYNKFRRPSAQPPQYGSPLPDRPLITDFSAVEESLSESRRSSSYEEVLRQSVEDIDINDVRLSGLGLSQSDLLDTAEKVELDIRQSMGSSNAPLVEPAPQNDLYGILQGIIDGAAGRIKALNDVKTLYEDFEQKLYIPLLDEIKKGQSQFVQVEEEIGRLRFQIRDLRKDMSPFGSEINQLKSQIQETIQQANVEFLRKKKELRDFVEMSENQFSDYVFAKTENSQLRSDLSDLQREVKKREESIESKKKKISDLESKVADFNEEIMAFCISWGDNFSLFLKRMNLVAEDGYPIHDGFDFDVLEQYMDNVIKGYGIFKTGNIRVYTSEYVEKLGILEKYLQEKVSFFSDLKPQNPEQYSFLEIEEKKKLFEIYDNLNLPDMVNDLLRGLRLIIEDLGREYPIRFDISIFEADTENDQKEIAKWEKGQRDIEERIKINDEIIARDNERVHAIQDQISEKESEYPNNISSVASILNDFFQGKDVWFYNSYSGLKAEFEKLATLKNQLIELEEKQQNQLQENKEKIKDIGRKIGNELESEKLNIAKQIQGYKQLAEQFVEAYRNELQSIESGGLLENDRKNVIKAAMLMKILERGNPIGENIFNETQTQESQNEIEFASLNLQGFNDFMRDWFEKLDQFEGVNDLLKSGSRSSSGNISSGHTVAEMSDPDGTFRRGVRGQSPELEGQ